MDIQDILQEFEASAQSSRKAVKYDIYQKLVRAMLNERMAPEVLPFQHELMRQVLDSLSNQQQFLIDSHEYGDSNADSGVISGDFKLQLMIVETEIERLNYLVRSYLRMRLSKLDKYNIYYINKVSQSSSDGENEAKPLLSNEESEYIHEHFRILTQLYNASFLKRMPHFLTFLDDTSGGQSMISEPNVNQPVFIKVVSNTPINVRLNQDEIIELEKDGIYVVSYKLISKYVQIGDVELI